MNLAKTTEEIFSTFCNHYWCNNQTLLKEYYPNNPNKEKYSYLWGYGALLTTVCSVIEATENNLLLSFAQKCFKGLEQYLSDRADFTVYNSAPKIQGYGEPFYDDNAWVALALLQMYELEKNDNYLKKAQAIAKYLLHGKNAAIGGIYWKENQCTSSNTCSSAPTIAVLLKLYNITKDEMYLNESKIIYDWVATKLIDPNGIYFDSLDNENIVCKWQFSYNTGVMIWVGIMLYEITGISKYLDDAIRSKKVAEKFFLAYSDSAKMPMLPKMPWFNVYLIQGFIAADKYDTNSVFKQILDCAEYAYNNARTKDGLFLNDWTDKIENLETPYYSINLDTLGSAECFALITKWQKARRKNGEHN